ncbi:hypothetical protein LT493_39700 [Streptomyces tricolor]|nr:hypothetical protein [Streptomyces tricolor]
MHATGSGSWRRPGRACTPSPMALLAGIGAAPAAAPLPVARYDLVLVARRPAPPSLARRVGWETRRDATAVITTALPRVIEAALPGG